MADKLLARTATDAAQADAGLPALLFAAAVGEGAEERRRSSWRTTARNRSRRSTWKALCQALFGAVRRSSSSAAARVDRLLMDSMTNAAAWVLALACRQACGCSVAHGLLPRSAKPMRRLSMNPDRSFSRRTALKTAAAGFGYLAFAGLSTWAAEKAKPARRQEAALPGEGQARHLPVHGRGAVARGHLRLQAEAQRTSTASRMPRRARPSPSCWPRRGSSPSTARAACGSPSCSPNWPSRPTTCACCAACTPTCRPIRRRSCRCTPACPSSSGRRWAPGRSTAWAPRTRTCPASSPSARRCRTAARPTTAALSCRPSTRARRSAAASAAAWRRHGSGRPRRRRAASATSTTRASRPTPSAMQLDFIQSLNRETLDREPHNPGVEGAIESFELAFRMQKDLPKVMDLVQRNRGDQGAVRHRRRRRPTTSAGNACWPGGSSRPACASSR